MGISDTFFDFQGIIRCRKKWLAHEIVENRQSVLELHNKYKISKRTLWSWRKKLSTRGIKAWVDGRPRIFDSQSMTELRRNILNVSDICNAVIDTIIQREFDSSRSRMHGNIPQLERDQAVLNKRTKHRYKKDLLAFWTSMTPEQRINQNHGAGHNESSSENTGNYVL